MTRLSMVISFSYTQHSYFVFFKDYICGYTVTSKNAAKMILYAVAM